MAKNKPLDRPCWRCEFVFTADQAVLLRKAGYHSATCPKCHAAISLHGKPNTGPTVSQF